jgi:hypothetical protein
LHTPPLMISQQSEHIHQPLHLTKSWWFFIITKVSSMRNRVSHLFIISSFFSAGYRQEAASNDDPRATPLSPEMRRFPVGGRLLCGNAPHPHRLVTPSQAHLSMCRVRPLRPRFHIKPCRLFICHYLQQSFRTDTKRFLVPDHPGTTIASIRPSSRT